MKTLTWDEIADLYDASYDGPRARTLRLQNVASRLEKDGHIAANSDGCFVATPKGPLRLAFDIYYNESVKDPMMRKTFWLIFVAGAKTYAQVLDGAVETQSPELVAQVRDKLTDEIDQVREQL